MRLDDPALVACEYGSEKRLRTRASVYASTEVETGDPRRLAFEAVAETGARRVLEVGCGLGELSETLARELGAEVVALDIAPRMVELARGRGVDARVGDVYALPFADGSVDAAVAAWML